MESPPSCSTRPTFISSPNLNTFERRVFSTSLEFLGNEGEKSYCDPDADSLCDEVDFTDGKKPCWLPDRIDPPLEFRDTPPTAAFRPRRAFTPPLNSLSPGTSNSSLRLSSSHNSLSVPTANRADDSSFITSAMSHDVLTDFYNVPFDSDIYTMPIDTIRPNPHKKRHHRNGKRRRRHTTVDVETETQEKGKKSTKRHSTPGPSEPVHMTLQEVRQFLHTLCNGPNDEVHPSTEVKRKHQRKSKSSVKSEEKPVDRQKKSSGVKTSISHLLKQTLCNVFRVRKTSKESDHVLVLSKVPPFTERALPPLPEKPPVPTLISRDDNPIDFAASIEKVKDYGWYWGPISGEAAEKVLSNEPDGSFIVRDSSDHHYIFSLTFRLNGCVRHVRIEHDQGNFSFGSCTKFKSQTIVEFIETAVEHSRSGRYLFFLHRRPILGPMRVQLLHPVSRFKHVQSLQHLCRFVIVKAVRRDLIPSLPLPRRLIDYLSSPQYYSEQLSDQDMSRSTQSLHLLSFLPPN